jgi:hypothetical protein
MRKRRSLSSKGEDTMAQVYETAGRFAARTPYNTAFVAAVKDLPGRRWDADAKVWTVDADQEAALRALVEQFFGKEEEAEQTPAPASTNDPKMVADFPTLEAYAKYVDGQMLKYAQGTRMVHMKNAVFHPIHVEGQAVPVGFRVEAVEWSCMASGVPYKEVLRGGSYKHIAAFFEAA